MTMLTAPQRVCTYDQRQEIDLDDLLTKRHGFGEAGRWLAARVTAIDMGHDNESDDVGNESVFVTVKVSPYETYYVSTWDSHYENGQPIPRTPHVYWYADADYCDDVESDEIEYLGSNGNIYPLDTLDNMIVAIAKAVRGQ
jgi:hypothetical protein